MLNLCSGWWKLLLEVRCLGAQILRWRTCLYGVEKIGGRGGNLFIFTNALRLDNELNPRHFTQLT
jgi:hypothetical protein